MKYTFGRDIVIASTMGHALRFEKGVALEVPRTMEADVVMRGGIPEDLGASQDVKEPDAVMAPESAAEREKAMFAVFEGLVLENVQANFTSGGSPKDSVVEQALGWPVAAKELQANWKKFKVQGT